MPGLDVIWQAILGSGALLLLAVPLARWIYVRRYLRHRLYFEPWINLSDDQSLEIGASLSEILYFELEKIREVLRKAETDVGLWNERSSLPLLERAFEGYPTFVRHVELLGLSGRLTKLVRLVLLARPQSIRGTIHKFGDKLRLQVMLEGTPGKGGDGTSSHCWATETSASERDSLPLVVAELAHMLVLDLGRIEAFKSPRSFMAYTRGLQHHLSYNDLNRREEYGLQAADLYRRAIQEEGRNALASYAIGQIFYSFYDHDKNEEAIREFQNALRSDVAVLRARAFRGLADAYCQRRHRHERGGDEALEDALRAATFASELCDARDEATIKKALAFATQMQAEQDGIEADRAEKYIEQAMDLYEQSILANPDFTVAHNNLGYLHLERAKRELERAEGSRDRPAGDERTKEELYIAARRDLEKAESCCERAIGSDATYPHAYDNLGNVWIERTRLPDCDRSRAFEEAEKSYHKAISYDPNYSSAYSDLALLHVRQFGQDGSEESEPAAQGAVSARQDHARRAWRFHFSAVECLGDLASKRLRCERFAETLRAYRIHDVCRWTGDEARARREAVGCECALEMG